ncbi:MAG: endonuclease/exonuclease/phosphatase family protein [Ruminococcaceae bacterium]|nr:endonuclease/exonuclease/phosphatase family protein [Oscillospiraceae bacterium]
MPGGILSGIISIIMSFITMITSMFGIIQNRPDNSVVQGFETKEAGAMRIMSFNIRCTNVGKDSWEDRIGIVSQTIIESEADSVGVQEATPEWMAALRETVGDMYAYVGVGRDDGDNEGEYSAIFYLKDKYNAIDSGTFWLSETPDKVSFGWDAACRRVCTWVVLENKETSEKYVHINSHFDHIGISARKNSVDMIVDKAKEYTDLPVVFTADMNVKQGSDNYNQFVESGVLRDTKFATTNTMDYCTYHDTKPQNHKDDVIDYVMINEHFDAVAYRVVTEGIDGRFVSDHYPIYADLIIK